VNLEVIIDKLPAPVVTLRWRPSREIALKREQSSKPRATASVLDAKGDHCADLPPISLRRDAEMTALKFAANSPFAGSREPPCFE
jgi:hypothetical protein